MARPKSTQPTDRELEILKLLWEHGPSALSRICEALRRDRPVATTTIATMLQVMQKKGLVQRKGKGTASPLWSAELTREAATQKLLHKLLDKAFDGSAQQLVAHMVQDGLLTGDELDQVRTLIEDHRRKKCGRARR